MTDVELAAARRTLMPLILGVALSVGSFAVVFGLTARDAGYSVAEAMLMSLLPFAGASQLAAVGYVQQGLPWLTIALLTGLLNARHVLYSASLAPGLRPLPLRQRLGMAQVLTDEAFALSAAHFQRLGRVDPRGYWLSAMLGVYLPWNVGTLIGVLAGGAIPDPRAAGPRGGLPRGDGRSGRRPDDDAGGAGGRLCRRRHRRGCRGLARAGGRDRGRRGARSAGGARPGALAVSDSLFVLAGLMWLATYPWRVGPLVLPGVERLPPLALAYLRLVGPAVLAALAAVAVLVSKDDGGHALHLGMDVVAVLVCVGLVAWRRNVLLGLVAAVAVMGVWLALQTS